MSNTKSLRKTVIIVLPTCTVLFLMLGYMLWVTSVVHYFSSDIKAMCEENFGYTREPLISMYKAVSDLNLSKPYAIFDNRYEGDSTRLTYDILDNNRKIVHVTTTVKDAKYHTEVAYDVSQEQIAAIQNTAELLVGADVSCDIPSTYFGYIPVKIQGVEYRWKDGVLERKH